MSARDLAEALDRDIARARTLDRALEAVGIDLYARPSQLQSVTPTSDASHRSDRLTGFPVGFR